MTSIVQSLQDPRYRREDISTVGHCWGALPKVNRYLFVRPAGLQVLVQCNWTRSTIAKVKGGLPTAPGRL